MNNKNTKFLMKLSLVAVLIFVLYLVLPKVYINEQSITLEKEAYEQYTVAELLGDYVPKNAKIYVNTNLGWKDTTLEDEISLEDEVLLKVLSKASFISSEENTIRIKGVDTIAPKIMVYDEDLVIEGGENLGHHLNFDVVDYRFGEYNYTLKKPTLNYIPLTLGKHTYTIEAKDLSGNSVTKDITFKVVEHEIDANEASKVSVWINKTRKLKDDYKPEVVDVPDEYSVEETQSLEKNTLKNFLKMVQDLESELDETLIIKNGFSLNDNPELQSGLALRLDTDTDFEKSHTYRWLKRNAHKYGFIIRYPEDKKEVTGYKFQSNFLRYVDKDISNYLYKNNLTFDEYQIND